MSDANMLFVPRTEILELLREAFDEGWNGYQDLKDATADRILDEYLARRKEKSDKGRSCPVEVCLEPLPESAFRSDDPTPIPTPEQVTFDFGMDEPLTSGSHGGEGVTWVGASSDGALFEPSVTITTNTIH